MTSLKTMIFAVSCDKAPLILTFRCWTVAKTLSIGFEGPQMVPMLSREIEEGQELLPVLGQAVHRLGSFGAVRHGHGPELVIKTGIGPMPVKRAKVRDRVGDDESGSAVAPVRFTSAILPKWAG